MKLCKQLKIKEHSIYFRLVVFTFSSFIFSIDYGIDVLIDNQFSELANKRVGVLANTSSINKQGKNIVDILINNENFSLIKIFAPEHGFASNYSAGEQFSDGSYRKIKVISLYGNNKKPKYRDVADLDVIVIDIQDIGSTYYTYISTVTYMLEIAAKYNISVIILDRPNPMGRRVYGPKKEKFNFIGLHPIPIRHGMTIGELCYMINNEGWLNNKIKDLKVIKIRDFKKINDFNEWLPPSPNIPDLKTAFIYNGMCLFEGTNISEGRGTAYPFRTIGAPWVDSGNLMNYIKHLKDTKYGNKVIIKESEFTPISNKGAKKPKYENQTCYGIFIEYIDKSIEPIDLAIDLLSYFNHYNDFSFKESFFDILYGSSDLRLSITNIDNLDKIISNIKEDVIEFNKVREKYLLY